MSKADEFRLYAQECMEDARAADDKAARKQFLDLADLWLKAAAKLDASPVNGETASFPELVTPRRSGIIAHDPSE